jgi:hypothetical protein
MSVKIVSMLPPFPATEAGRSPTTKKNVAALIDYLKELSPTAIALEATGGIETVLACALAGAGLKVAVTKSELSCTWPLCPPFVEIQ